LEALTGLSDEQLEKLSAALHEPPAALAPERLAAIVAEALPELQDVADEIFDAVESLVSLLSDDDDDEALHTLAVDVSESPDIDLAEEARARFARVIEQIIGLRTVVLAARAHDLVGEHERGFHDARIVTDIRPVFGRNAEDGPEAALVVSSLKVEFHRSDGALDSFFFALDRSDLLRLHEIVDRALKKTEALVSMIARAELPYWEYIDFDDASTD
jgi:hypothetical protein